MRARIAVFLSFAILFGLFACGATRWLVASDLLALFRPDRYDSIKTQAGPPAKGDFDEDLSATVYRPLHYDPTTGLTPVAADRVRELQALAERFPNRPGLYAAAAMFAMRDLELYEPDRCVIENNVDCDYPPPKNDPFVVKSLVSDTEAACRLEPGNGYFAALESYACFIARRDSDGLAAFARAASCTDWNDHEDDAFRGVVRRLPWTRRQDAIAVNIIQESRAGWESIGMKALARRILAAAANAETQGKFAEGARLRRLMRRVGSLMRSESHAYSGAYTGTVFVWAANSRRIGVYVEYPPGEDSEMLEAKAAAAFLKTHGNEADGADVLREATLNRQAQSILKASDARLLRGFSTLVYYRVTLRFVEMMALLLALWAIATGALMHTAPMRARTQLATPAAWGIGLAVVVWAISTLTVLCRGSSSATSSLPITYQAVVRGCIVAFFVIVAAYAFLLSRGAVSADEPRAQAFTTFATTLLVALFAYCLLLAAAVLESRALTDLFSLLSATGGASTGWVAFGGTQLLTALSSVPLLIAILAAAAARVKRQPLAVTILLSWRAALPWVVCVLVAAYAGLTAPAVSINNELCSQAYQRVENATTAIPRSERVVWPAR